MQFSKRLDNFFSISTFQFGKRYSFAHNNFSKMLCVLLLGFITGSLFASSINTIQEHLICVPTHTAYTQSDHATPTELQLTGGGIIRERLRVWLQLLQSCFGICSQYARRCTWFQSIGIGLILFMEIVSYLTYSAKNRSFFFFIISSRKINQAFWRFANMFKIGLMLGFFVDAFKVGS